MVRRDPITFLLPVELVVLGALTVAGCGSGGRATAATPTIPSRHQPTVSIAASRLRQILVDSRGRALYLFKADSGRQTACAGACAVAWPPLLARGEPRVGAGIDVSLIATIRRPDGTRQVTYNGHPLYAFADDEKPGDVKGQGVTAFGAPWYALTPTGDQVTSPPPSSGTGVNSPGSSAY